MSLEIIGAGNWMRLVRDGKWEFVERTRGNNAVVIANITTKGTYFFVEQWRPALKKNVIEWPAGLIGDTEGLETETILEAAKRELLEEVGLESNNISIVNIPFTSSPGLTSECVHFALAFGCTQACSGGGVEGENIKIHEISVLDVHDWINLKGEENYVIDAKIYAGIELLCYRKYYRG